MNANLREADYTCGDFFNLLCASVVNGFAGKITHRGTETQRRIKSGL
jgi:hypothetical protein